MMRQFVYAGILLVLVNGAGHASNALGGDTSLPRSTGTAMAGTAADGVAETIARVERKIRDRNLIGAYTEKQDIMELGSSQDPRAIPVLNVIIDSYPSIVAKREAVTALQMIARNDASAMKGMEKALADKNILVRFHAASALAGLGRTDREVCRTLRSVTGIRDLNELDKALFEDEWIYAADMPYYLCMQGKREEAVRISPSAVNIDADGLSAWCARFDATREGIVVQALRKLRRLDTGESRTAIRDAAQHGASERIRQEARQLLEDTK